MWDPEEMKIPILGTLCGKMDEECMYLWGGEGSCSVR